MPPGCNATSAIIGFPTTMVATLPGILNSVARSTLTPMTSFGGPARAAAGHNRSPAASDRNPTHARARLRKELNDILYPGAVTSRQKRYAAEPAPDPANLTVISE